MLRSPAPSWIVVLTVALLMPTGATAKYAMALGYEPKYPEGFEHFEYVNPDAPRGGHVTLSAFGSYESLNPFLLKSTSAAGLLTLVFESLMVKSLDEPFTMYGLLADDIRLAEDGMSVTFHLNPKARFSNGDPVLARDVKASFKFLTGPGAHPRYRLYWRDIKGVEILDRRTIRFHFKRPNPELHLIIAEMPVFSHEWIGDRPFNEVITDPPIASGPYIIEGFEQGESITYRRNPDYWAEDLNVRRGMFNFKRITFQYYRDRTIAFEAFKAGAYDFHLELQSKRWARAYDGPAFETGRIVQRLLPHQNNAGMQGFIFNLRNPLFQDRRVRRAINLAFDFAWSNQHLFYGQYTRSTSYFSNSELAHRNGPARDRVRALLDKYRDIVPQCAFGPIRLPPGTAGPDSSLRENLRRARELLRQAGWHVAPDGVLRNEQGEPFRFTFLLAQEAFERILAPFFRNLEHLGMRPQYRTVAPALYRQQLRTFEFDMAVMVYPQSQSPGNELRSMFHSETANEPGTRNYIGIQDPAVDALVEEVIYAGDRDDLIVATRALDRVLMCASYVVPNWYIDAHRVAYWDRFGIPDTRPLYYYPRAWMLKTWWIKQDEAG